MLTEYLGSYRECTNASVHLQIIVFPPNKNNAFLHTYFCRESLATVIYYVKRTETPTLSWWDMGPWLKMDHSGRLHWHALSTLTRPTILIDTAWAVAAMGGHVDPTRFI